MNIVRQRIRIFKFLDRQIDLMFILLSVYSCLLYSRFMIGSNLEKSLILTNNSLIHIIVLVVLYLIFLTVFEYRVHYRSTKIWTYVYKIFFVSYFSVSSYYLTIFILKRSFMPKMNDFIVQSDLDLLLNNPYFVISIALLATCLLIFKRICMKILLSSIRQAGFDTKNIAIIGVNRQAINLVNEFSRHQEYGFIVKGVFNTNSNNEKTKIFYNETEISEIIYDLSQFQDFIIKNNIDEVFITFDPNKIKNFESIVNFLNFTGISYHFTISTGISKIENKSEFKVVADEYYGMPMTSYHSVPANIYSLVLKSVVEKMLALLLIIFTLPVSIITAILIKFSSPGAIFFKQERVGLRGRTFKQYKFRSMTEDADSRKKDLEHLNEQSGPVFKITNDPRLTKVGKYIRKFSIDELPQLINVIIGNMSLIGPRPPIPNEVKEYSTIHRRRLSMKPGITGLWQVSGRNSIQNFEDWVKIDLSYIDNWSFWLDIKIALKTIFVVISGTGK